MVRLDCLIKLKYEAFGTSTFILNVEPARTSHQNVAAELLQINGDVRDRTFYETPERNRLVRFSAQGVVEITSRFTVDLEHAYGDAAQLREPLPSNLPLSVLPYLSPSRYCESDKLMPFAQSQFGWATPGYGRVLAIRNWVRENVEFKIGTTRWDTSASDVLRQRQGVCRDFAHVMIAMCRALNMPARFVTGIDYGADPALGPVDFHAYVEVLLGDRWYLFDPTGISPTSGLVRLATGRDASDVAFATIFGSVSSWNPYLEVAAIQDVSRGIELPTRHDEPISTAGLDFNSQAPGREFSPAVERNDSQTALAA